MRRSADVIPDVTDTVAAGRGSCWHPRLGTRNYLPVVGAALAGSFAGSFAMIMWLTFS